MTKLEDIRREYGKKAFNKKIANPDPIQQFELWLEEAITAKAQDPTAMVVSTIDQENFPDSRIVLLKAIEDQQFIFYTHKKSQKALQILKNNKVALNFYWPILSRQIRIKGYTQFIDDEIAKKYFQSRPRDNQIASLISPQSTIITHREILEKNFQQASEKFSQTIPYPENWCGIAVTALEFEFFQGRDSRLHDRLRYQLKSQKWIIERLAP